MNLELRDDLIRSRAEDKTQTTLFNLDISTQSLRGAQLYIDYLENEMKFDHGTGVTEDLMISSSGRGLYNIAI